MNFLAHIFLSFGDDEITIGNFIADSIRGNKYGHLPERIQKGILLHREIDTYTDTHPITKQSSKRLHPNHGHYSRVVVDIFYDHFLARNWKTYSDISLDRYVSQFYELLDTHYPILPIGVQKMMPYMIGDNWLLNYAHIEGINRVLKGMYRRTNEKSNMNFAVLDLQEHYDLFENEFHAFFEELIIFSDDKFKRL
jgi:acyl carrier protein phosphodiesterase